MNQPCDIAGKPTIEPVSVVEFLCSPQVSARYISLDIDRSSPGVTHAMLQIAEVIVKEYHSKECVTNDTLSASDWTATQSSDTVDNPARDATDGSISTYSSTYNDDLHPWWRLDLGDTHWLGKITLILATAAASQSNTIIVRAGNSTHYTQNTPCNSSGAEVEYKPGAVIKHVCDPPIRASYVTVDMESAPSTDPVLRIAEIAVERHVAEDCARNGTSIAAASTATERNAQQSSELERHIGSHANDGDTKTYFKSANLVDDPHTWWQVDLINEHCIGRITVKFEGNTVPHNFIVLASAENGTDFSKKQKCGLKNDHEFLCDPPLLARYITLSADSSVPAVETAYLQVTEVNVEQYPLGVGPCMNWDDPNRKTKSAYISKKFKGRMSMSESALHRAVASNVKQCTQSCIHHSGCISFVFSQSRGECSLFSQYPSEVLSRSGDTEDSYWVYDLSE